MTQSFFHAPVQDLTEAWRLVYLCFPTYQEDYAVAFEE